MGYRYIGPAPLAAGPRAGAERTADLQTLFPATSVVGREADLERLHGWLMQAHGGRRQIVLIAGEPGIGKTALVDAFVSQIGAEQQCWPVRGQCVEHHGPGEPYRPVLAALGQLGQRPDGALVTPILRQYAPMWLMHLPSLVPAHEQGALHDMTRGITKERMLREMVDAMEVMTAEHTLVLVLEDLHWSDGATLDLIGLLARRRTPARLFVLGTYRPADMHLHSSALYTLTQELSLHRQCVGIDVQRLSVGAVESYLRQRFPEQILPPRFVQWLHHHTEGHPLFMTSVVAYVEAQGLINRELGDHQPRLEAAHLGTLVPRSVDQLTELYLSRLTPDDVALLEIGSVAGPLFSTAIVARVLEQSEAGLEQRCAALARTHLFLRESGIDIWPDQTVTTCYTFTHALYQQAIYKRLARGYRIRLHRRVGECLKAAYGAKAHEVAAVLALHFEQGLDYHRAVPYLEQAAVNAMQRCAYEEAILHLNRGLALLPHLANAPEQARYELTFHVMLGPALIATRGWGAAEVEQTFARAYHICQQSTADPHIFPALHGLWTFHLVRAQLVDAYHIGERLLSTAEAFEQPAYRMMPHTLRGGTLFYQGNFSQAYHHFEQGLHYYDPEQHRDDAFLYGQDFKITALAFAAWTQWYLGRFDEARAQLDAVLALAHHLKHPFTLAFVLGASAYVYQCLRQPAKVKAYAEELIDLSRQQGFPQQEAMGMMFDGWSQVLQGVGQAGIAQLQQGLEQYRATGAKIQHSHWLALLAEAYGQIGRQEDSLSMVNEAMTFARRHGERFYEAELYRLRGEALRRCPGVDSVQIQRNLQRACAIAKRQQAKVLELRAMTNLCQWVQQPPVQARQRLSMLCNYVSTADEILDLQAAREVVATWS